MVHIFYHHSQGLDEEERNDPEKKMEKMETDERSVEEKCKDAQNNSQPLTIASLLSSSLSSGARAKTLVAAVRKETSS